MRFNHLHLNTTYEIINGCLYLILDSSIKSSNQKVTRLNIVIFIAIAKINYKDEIKKN